MWTLIWAIYSSMMVFISAKEPTNLTFVKRWKRQTGTFSQPQFTFTPTSCVPGVPAGKVTASSSTGSVFFTISKLTPTSNMAVNPNTGQIIVTNFLTPGVSYSATIQSRSGGLIGGSVLGSATITIICSNSAVTTTAASSMVTFPIFTQNPYLFSLTSCTAGTVVGQVSVSKSLGTTYSLGTSALEFTVNAQTGQIILTGTPTATRVNFAIIASNAAGMSAAAVTVTTSCSSFSGSTGGTITGTAPVFSQPSGYTFNFQGTTCSTGTIVGIITATSPSGTLVYSIGPSTSGFTISSLGAISLSTTSSGNIGGFPTVLTASAANSFGTTTVPVSITLTCASATPFSPTTFSQSSYTFFPTLCSTSNQVGQVTAQNSQGAVTYTIQVGVPGYDIDPNTGVITISSSAAVDGPLAIMATGPTGQTAVTQVAVSTTSCKTSNNAGCTPQFLNTPYYFQSSMCSMNNGGIAVGTVQAFSACPNAVIRYTQSGVSTSRFAVDSVTGNIFAAVTNQLCNPFTVTATITSGINPVTVSSTVLVDCRGPGKNSGVCDLNLAILSLSPCAAVGTESCGDL